MKKILVTFAAVTAALCFSTSAQAADKTLKGEGLCAKCELKETAKCQNAVRVEEGGKKVIYYLEDNDVSKAFHKTVCSSTAKVTAVGTVSEKDGKKWLKASKITENK